MPRSTPLWMLLAALGALVAFGAGRFTGERGSVGSTQAPLDPEPILAELRASREAQERTASAIAELETALLELRGAAVTPTGTASAVATHRQPVGAAVPDAWTELTASVDALRSAVEEATRERRAALDGSASGAIARSLERRPDIDPSSVDVLIGAWQADPAGARRERLLWTPAKLVETYGRPTDVWREKSGLCFVYVRDWGPAGEEPLRVGFRICDGVVVHSWMEPYRPDGEGD